VLSQLNYNIVGMIIGWFFTKFVNRLPVAISRWPPWYDLPGMFIRWSFTR